MSEEGTVDAPPGKPAANASRGPGEGRFLEHLLKVRYLAVVVVILALAHSVIFLFMGARISVATYWHILGSAEVGLSNPGVELLHSLDLFLVSLVLMILALGVAKLFLLPPTAHPSAHLPDWLHIETFSDLKFILWETILTTLLIAALPVLVAGMEEDLDWTALVIPAAILLLAFSLYCMRKT
jgi:uncharacterized membrane protein YqhA